MFTSSKICFLLGLLVALVEGQYYYYYYPTGSTGTTTTQQQQLYYYYYHPTSGGTTGTTSGSTYYYPTSSQQQLYYYYYPTGSTSTSTGTNQLYYYYYYPTTSGGTTTGTTTTPYYTSTPQYCTTSPYTSYCSAASCYYSLTRNQCCLTYYISTTGSGQVYQVCSCATGTICAPEPTQTAATTAAPVASTAAPASSTAAAVSSTAAPASSTAAPASSTAAPVSTTAAAASTTAAAASTTAAPASTTAAPASTTAAAESTTAAAETTTAAAETTTAAATTPSAKRALCVSGLRILNGDSADSCTYPGITNITTQNGDVVSCNAVLVMASVDGTYKPTFLTSNLCLQILIQTSSPTNLYEIQIGNQLYPVMPPLFNLIEGPDGTGFISLDDRYINLLNDLGTCQQPACPYDPATMDGEVDFNDCKIVSYGASDSATLTSDGLYETSLVQNNGGCSGIPDLFNAANTLCYQTSSGNNLFCSGDSGAPVYCKATTDEWILIGSAAFQPGCDATSNIKVLPYPG